MSDYDTIVQCKKCGKKQYLRFANGLKNGWSKESEDGIELKCQGCGKVRSYEIGLFSDYFDQFTKAVVSEETPDFNREMLEAHRKYKVEKMEV